MDQERFDRIAAALGGAATRRAGLRAALVALAGLGAGGAMAAAKPHEHHDGRADRAARPAGGHVDEQRPCGPTAKDNACKKDGDCCTNYCKPPKKKGGKGRCRCIKTHKPCKKGQTCCGGATCTNKTCTPPATCGPAGGACAADADCCSGLTCNAGSCWACTPTVCASGCAFTSVNAAYAAAADGDTIYIGPGTYPTGIEVDKDITLSACPGVTGVTLQPDDLITSPYGNKTMISESTTDTTTKRTVTLLGLDLTPGADAANEAFMDAYTNGTVAFTVRNCTMTGTAYGIAAYDGDHEFTDGSASAIREPFQIAFLAGGSLTVTGSDISGATGYTIWIKASTATGNVTLTVDGCTIHDNATYVYFDGVTSNTPAQRQLTQASFTNSSISGGIGYRGVSISGGVVTIDGCTITGNQGAGIDFGPGDLTVSNTTISGNDTTASLYNYGAGITVFASTYSANLTLGAGVIITGNTSADGSGLAVRENSAGLATITGASSSNIYGNLVGDNCEYKLSTGAWTPVNNCSF